MVKLGVLVGSAPINISGEGVDDIETPWGVATDRPQRLDVSGVECFVLRRHGADRSISPHQVNYRANVWLMQQLGVTALLGTHTVGAIDPRLSVGALVLPHQLIDYTWGRPSTFDDQRRHIEFSSPYSETLRDQLLGCVSANAKFTEADEATSAAPNLIDGGIYGCTQGPRLETAAEISRMAGDGCTIVGMTGMPEAALAGELGIPFASVCLVVNPAAGVGDANIDMQALAAASKTGAADIWSLVLNFVQVTFRLQ